MYNDGYRVLNIFFFKQCRTLMVTTFLLQLCTYYLPYIEEEQIKLIFL